MSAPPIPIIGPFSPPGRCWCGCGVPLATQALFTGGHREQALRRHRLEEQVAAFLSQPGVPANTNTDLVAVAALAGAGVGPSGICPWQWRRLVPVPPAPVAKAQPLPLVFDGTDDLAGQIPAEWRPEWAKRHPVAAAVLDSGERLAFRWPGDQLYAMQQAAEWETRATPEAHDARDRLDELRREGGVDKDTVRAALRELWQAEATTPIDVGVPLDRALDRRDRTGDTGSYLAELQQIVAAEPLDVDAWAHLGNHHLEAAWAAHQRRARQRAAEHRLAALDTYRTAIAVVEQSLPTGFSGLLVRGWLENRPVHRALHGLATAAWWAGQTDTARATAETMAWTNPGDTIATVYLVELDTGVDYLASTAAQES
jgi:hypothetical protein